MKPEEIKKQIVNICKIQNLWTGCKLAAIHKIAKTLAHSKTYEDSDLAILMMGIFTSGDYDYSRLIRLSEIMDVKLYRLQRLKNIFKKDKTIYSEIIHNKIAIERAYRLLRKRKNVIF